MRVLRELLRIVLIEVEKNEMIELLLIPWDDDNDDNDELDDEEQQVIKK